MALHDGTDRAGRGSARSAGTNFARGSGLTDADDSHSQLDSRVVPMERTMRGVASSLVVLAGAVLAGAGTVARGLDARTGESAGRPAEYALWVGAALLVGGLIGLIASLVVRPPRPAAATSTPDRGAWNLESDYDLFISPETRN